MNTIHTKYMKDMQERTGLQIRDLQARWQQAERQLAYDRMYDPSKYKYMQQSTGSISEEIKRRFEDTVLQPEKAAEEVVNTEMDNQAEDMFGQDIEQELDSMPQDSDKGDEEPFDFEFSDSAEGNDVMSGLDELYGDDESDTDITPNPDENASGEETDKEKSPDESELSDAGDVNA